MSRIIGGGVGLSLMQCSPSPPQKQPLANSETFAMRECDCRYITGSITDPWNTLNTWKEPEGINLRLVVILHNSRAVPWMVKKCSWQALAGLIANNCVMDGVRHHMQEFWRNRVITRKSSAGVFLAHYWCNSFGRGGGCSCISWVPVPHVLARRGLADGSASRVRVIAVYVLRLFFPPVPMLGPGNLPPLNLPLPGPSKLQCLYFLPPNPLLPSKGLVEEAQLSGRRDPEVVACRHGGKRKFPENGVQNLVRCLGVHCLGEKIKIQTSVLQVAQPEMCHKSLFASTIVDKRCLCGRAFQNWQM